MDQKIKLLFIFILILVLVLVGIKVLRKKEKEGYISNDLIKQIIDIIIFTPLSTRDLVEIVNGYSTSNPEDEFNYKKKLREVIGFLRFSNFVKYEDYFRKEATRYLEDENIFNLPNLSYFVNKISEKIREKQIQEDDLD